MRLGFGITRLPGEPFLRDAYDRDPDSNVGVLGEDLPLGITALGAGLLA